MAVIGLDLAADHVGFACEIVSCATSFSEPLFCPTRWDNTFPDTANARSRLGLAHQNLRKGGRFEAPQIRTVFFPIFLSLMAHVSCIGFSDQRNPRENEHKILMQEQDDLWRRIQDVFERALRCSAAERQRYVRETCTGNQDLIDEVESLLAAYEQAEVTLERLPEIEIDDQENP